MKTETVVNATKIRGAEAGPARYDEFTYTVLLDIQASRPSNERRDSPRRRTRLRSGKVVDAHGRFVTECLVHDLSGTGGRLRLPPTVVLPSFIQIYDDQSGVLHRAEVLWRKGSDAGVQFVPEGATQRSRAIANEMRRKFYKVQR
jgi:hypothetical protein